VITVVAASTSSKTATLQAWDKINGGWVKHGAAVSAYVGSAGLSSHPSESVSATPIGSFALTRAFGSLTNPGTAISYHQTTSADWWISQYGGAYASIYNTMQTCSSSCPFNQGDPNEHLASITPEYRYAVVIEYNTTAPVVQGGGSAFFLHVANGAPTAGCVAIPQASLVAIMQWLNPAAAPRILIGVG
jgi:L,D-peptidoglycan transpeptidase YkuD (ErfK/YbiS/YcfS/YnhG family)